MDENFHLQDPLLSFDRTKPNMNDSIPIEWPSSEARRAKFYTPKEWRSVHGQCYFEYNATQNYLNVVSALHPPEILDVIDLEDVIGADLEITLTVTTESSRSSSTAAVPERAYNEPASDGLKDNLGAAVLSLYTYPRRNPSQESIMASCFNSSAVQAPKQNPKYTRSTDTSKLGDRYSVLRSFVLVPCEDLKDASTVLAAVRQLATGRRDSMKPPNYLVVVNPRSGPKRNGVSLCNQYVKSMLEQSGIQVDVCVTKYPRHAIDRMRSKGTIIEPDSIERDLKCYDGLILIGGDGIIHEALNGIMSRPDHEEVLQKVKIGVLGCGTANGLATSLALFSGERYGIVNETFLVCKNQSLWCDISKYRTRNHTYFSFLTFTWSMIADIDIESERIHFLGELRFDVWGVIRVLFLRRYRARLSFLPATEYPPEPVSENDMPSLTESVPNSWKTIEDDIVLLWASQVSHASMNIHQSPRSHPQDGIFRILLVRGKVSRLRMALILLSLEAGIYDGMPGTEFIDCTAFRLEPLTPGSYYDVDGETVEQDGPILAYVIPKAVQFFCRPKLSA